MVALKRTFIFWLSITFFLFQLLSPTAMAESLLSSASMSKEGVTFKAPQIVSTPEKNIPAAEESGGNWLWAILGVVLVGGIAAAVAGGGGDSGGGGDDDDDDGSGSGSITGSW